MEAQFDRDDVREERKTPAQARAAETPEAMRLASQIGNQAVQRVATSPELQRSPAAAGLVGGRVLARQGVEGEEAEAEAGTENAAEAAGVEAGGAEAAGAEAAGNENVPEAAGNENVPEAAGNENAGAAEGNENAEATGNENEEEAA